MAAQIYVPVGVNTDTEYATADAPFAVGTVACGTDGSEWIFAENIALSAGHAVAINKTTYKAAKLTNALAVAGDKIAIAQATKTAGKYGWFLTKTGSTTTYVVAVRASCAPFVSLFTSAVAGLLDDASGTSLTHITGIVLSDTASASAGTPACFITNNLEVGQHVTK